MLSLSGAPLSIDKTRVMWLAAINALLYGVIAIPMPAHDAMPAAFVAASLGLAAGLSLLSACDVTSWRLPDILTLPLLVAGLALAGLGGMENLAWHGASALLGGLSLYVIGWLYLHYRGMDGLGLGDAKLFAAAGAWVGAEGLATVLLMACGSALVAALVWKRMDTSVDGQSAIPFGPFLALGLWVVWLYGPLS